MPAVYSNALSPKANQVLSTHYGETGLKYGGNVNWSMIGQMLWLHFVKKLEPAQLMYQIDHPLQLHYGIWDKKNIKNFNQNIRRATQVAF